MINLLKIILDSNDSTLSWNSAYWGGGIYCEYSNLYLSDCMIIHNTAEIRGGGLALNMFSNPTILNCCFADNSAFRGGGLSIDSQSIPTICNCSVNDNSAEYAGGGIFIKNHSNIFMSECIITSNVSANRGGGIYIENAAPFLYHSIICGNTAINYGGGLNLHFEADAIISNCSIYENSANLGGGINMMNYSVPTISNCLIHGNSANSTGGGIRIQANNNPTPIISQCTLYGNYAGENGSGMYVIWSSTPTIVNSIFEGNTGNNALYCDELANFTLTYSNFHNNEGENFAGNIPDSLGELTTVNANGDSCDAFNNILLNPQFYSTFGDSAFYLAEGSPCIDAGDPDPQYFDPDGTIADIGAYFFDQSPQLETIEDLIISIDGDNVYLDWTAVPEATLYYIYRSTDPFFDTVGMPPYDVTLNAGYEDSNALTSGTYFYRVTWE